jgi:ABC-2 type transport system ATP-binding protein
MIRIDNLVKSFGAKRAVDGISFTVERGEVLGFLGPNGAGKSTTMRMITGFMPPTEGSVAVGGFDVEASPLEAKRLIGYLPENAAAYPDMTVEGFLNFAAELRGLSGAARRKALHRVIERCFLDSVLHQSIDTLSKGYKHRTCLAQALIHDPEVLVLDEPTDGLDPNQKHHVRTLLADMAKDKAIIISTHILEEVDALCTRAIVIAKGKIVADAKPAELEARSSYHHAVTLRLPASQVGPATGVVETVEGVIRVEASDLGGGVGQLLAFPGAEVDILDPVCRAIERAGLAVNEVYVERGRLDEVFRQLTQAAA